MQLFADFQIGAFPSHQSNRHVLTGLITSQTCICTLPKALILHVREAHLAARVTHFSTEGAVFLSEFGLLSDQSSREKAYVRTSSENDCTLGNSIRLNVPQGR